MVIEENKADIDLSNLSANLGNADELRSKDRKASDTIDLSKVSESLGKADELHPKDRARLKMAYMILIGVFILCILSGWAILCVPDSKLSRAQQLFEFVKGFGPPLVTLVLGFYFRDAAGDN